MPTSLENSKRRPDFNTSGAANPPAGTPIPNPFKAQVVQECLQPGVSMASVALRHGINANLVRKWIPAYRDRQAPALPAFAPMTLEPRTQADQPMPISIEIPFGQQKPSQSGVTADLVF
ncbi:IS66-like element accessory protein TnpA [Pseudomonas sp. MWU13-2105]|uniref:IS66-like element accessory protein TnpA n=1 Tax=Pseudomonas sp. MWU13-2105 TaxID=2935074 RepID=UPI00200ECD16|nr:transposase [Pseudomonas sp. MWU13-2105]